MKNSPEYDLQCACYKWFELQYPNCIFASTHNESAYNRKAHFKKSGLCPGFPDVLLIIPGDVVFVEFKAPKPHTSHISQDQKIIGAKIESLLGEGHWFVVNSFEQFQGICNNKIKR